MDTGRLLRSLIEDPIPYIKVPSALGQFTNTCVLDSLLAALHTAYIKYPNIEEILNRNDFFTKVMSLLKEKKYTETQILCVQELNHGKVDLYGNVKDYFPMIAKLICAEITYKQSPPNDAIYKEIPSMLKQCGDVMVLGDPSDPTLILVHREVHNVLYQDCKSTELPLHVDDEKKRIFALQFLLLGKEEHMTTCFQSFENMWHLYDNDPKKPSFQPFDLESLKNYVICLAGYVNISQVKEYKLGIAETGEGAGAKPYYSHLEKEQEDPSKYFYQQQSVADVEMEDLDCTSSYSVAETGEGLGPQPFGQNWPEVSPKLKQSVEDTEMLSCSSSDSD